MERKMSKMEVKREEIESVMLDILEDSRGYFGQI